ncbi:MAG: helix-turn-helix transcriptional regulator [Elusimicrobiota bacterium]
MNIKKYFWSLNSKAIGEIKKILKNPDHPEFSKKMVAILSRCDKPKEVFSLISKKKFTEVWPKIRRYWIKTNQSTDFRAWWETVYEGSAGIEKKKTLGDPSKVVAGIGKIIRNNRIENGISQSDLAKRTGIKQPDISAIEKGKKNITLETLLRLCKVLGIKNIPVK